MICTDLDYSLRHYTDLCWIPTDGALREILVTKATFPPWAGRSCVDVQKATLPVGTWGCCGLSLQPFWKRRAGIVGKQAGEGKVRCQRRAPVCVNFSCPCCHVPTFPLTVLRLRWLSLGWDCGKKQVGKTCMSQTEYFGMFLVTILLFWLQSIMIVFHSGDKRCEAINWQNE